MMSSLDPDTSLRHGTRGCVSTLDIENFAGGRRCMIMMRTSMSSLASLKPVPVRGKKKKMFCPQKASSSVPSCHFSIRKQAGDSPAE